MSSRREFITLLGGAAAAWPMAARAQQGERVRRIGMLMAATENDMEWQNLVKVFIQRLQELGWTQDRNLKIDFRWAETGSDRLEALAKELVELKPELIISQATVTTIVLLQQTRTVPIAASLGMEAIVARVRDMTELDSVIAAQARDPNSGLMVMPDGFMFAHHAEIALLAGRYRLPAVASYRAFAKAGGLLSYGNDILDNYRRAATYADRILKGEKPSELPVQFPVKFELVINLTTAKALGLEIPPNVLARADEVIE